MKKYIPLLIPFSANIFFVLLSILNLEYNAGEYSKYYVLYNILFFVLGLIIFIIDCFNKEVKYKNSVLKILFIPYIITFFFLLDLFRYGIVPEIIERYLQFNLWSLPSLLLGMYLAQKQRYLLLERIIDVLILLFSFVMLQSVIQSLQIGTRANIAGGSSLSASYLYAFTFGLNLYYILFGKHHNRFRIFKTKTFIIISYVLLALQLLGVILAGGRGGMVLTITYVVYFSGMILLSEINKKDIRNFLAVVVLVIGGIYIIINAMEGSIISAQVSRIFSYISTDGIDWTNTSNRNLVYGDAVRLFRDSPILGYGLFGFLSHIKNYPHNLVLEILLQGGIFYLIIFTVMMFSVIRKHHYLLKSHPKLKLINVLFLYPLVMLMFSGSYMITPLFWFCLSYIVSSNSTFLLHIEDAS